MANQSAHKALSKIRSGEHNVLLGHRASVQAALVAVIGSKALLFNSRNCRFSLFALRLPPQELPPFPAVQVKKSTKHSALTAQTQFSSLLTMKRSYHAEREPANRPPITKAGRPTEPSYSPVSEKPHRSSSKSSRHSNHSRRRSMDMSEAEEPIDDLVKRPTSHGVMQRLKNKLSSLTQQRSVNNAVKNP